MLAQLQQRFPEHETTPSLSEIFDAVAELAGAIERYGVFNFMLSNGDVLFAHCSTNLHYVARAYPFSTARLIDCDVSIDFSQHNNRDDRMTVIATKPLTSNEDWTAFKPGELKMFAEGRIAAHCAPLNRRTPPAAETPPDLTDTFDAGVAQPDLAPA